MLFTTALLKMNAGEQSFNHMPFIIDYSHELIVQQVQNIKKQTKYHTRGNEVMEKNFHICDGFRVPATSHPVV